MKRANSIMKFDHFLSTFVEWIFRMILVFLLAGVMIAVVKFVGSVIEVAQVKDIYGSYKSVILDIFTLLILLELSKSFIEYIQFKKVRMVHVCDAGIVFLLRDIMISLYTKNSDKHSESEFLIALAVLLFVIGALRVALMLAAHKTRRPSEVDLAVDPKSTEVPLKLQGQD